jgi:hypothetical protein
MRKYFLIATLLCVLVPSSAWAADVQAVIPTFPVVLNGRPMENTYNKYPLLVYRDITYFPMAYGYARFLKLKSNWHENTRVRALFVGIAEDAATELNPYKTTDPNKRGVQQGRHIQKNAISYSGPAE